MINALGLLEVGGIMAAVDVADAILKAANVRLPSREVFGPGRLTLVVEGNLVACRTTPDAGSTAVAYTGHAINHKETGRPGDDTQWPIGGLKCQPRKSKQKPEAKTEVKPEKAQDAPVTSESSAQPLTLLASVC